MNILITGTSRGIGRGIAVKFLENGHDVIGFDLLESSINHPNYKHYQIDIRSKELPELKDIDILINNAGTQEISDAISTNLLGTMNICDKYVNKNLKSILFIGSASARNGAEFPEYVASKGGMTSFMKNLALKVAEFGCTCNSIAPGGVLTESNAHIINDKIKYQKVLNETLLNKWANVEEVADLAYFLTVINKSITGEDILIDNGEMLKSNFIW